MQGDTRPLVLQVMYRFDTSGLDNGTVNLIDHMPSDAYRHAVLALTEVTDCSQRIQRQDVEFISLRKQPGHGVWQYPKLFKLFRQLRPAIVHSHNLAALLLTRRPRPFGWWSLLPILSVRSMGRAGRQRAPATFSMQAMVFTYQRVYDQPLGRQMVSLSIQQKS